MTDLQFSVAWDMREESRVIGRNVRRYRQSMQWTQEMLAAEVKLSSDYISRLELGKENPTLDVLVRLSVVLQREVVELFMTEEQGQGTGS